MAISYVGVGTAATDNAATTGARDLTPALPAGVQAGDLLLLAVLFRNNFNSGMAAIPGWTKLNSAGVASTGTLGLYWRVYQAGDGPPALTVDDITTRVAQVVAFRGVDQSTPFGGIGWAAPSNGNAQNIGPITAGSTAQAGEAVVVLGGKRDDWTSVATLTGDSLTWSEISEVVVDTSFAMVWDYAIAGAAGAITSKTFTVTGGTTARYMGEVVSLKPAAAATNWSQPVADTPAVTDASTRRTGKAVADAGAATDALTREPGKALADTAAATDAVSVQVGKAVADSVAAADAVTRASGKSLAEDPALTDAASATQGHGVNVADTVVAEDAVSRAASRAQADDLAVGDETSATVGKPLADAASASDEVTTTTAYVRELADGLVVSDAQQTAGSGALALGDGAAVTDEVNVQLGVGSQHHTVELADTCAATDAVGKAAGVRLVDAATAADLIASKAVGKRASDTASLTDATSRAAQLRRELNDALTIADTVARSYGVQVADELAASDHLEIGARALTLHLADGASLADDVVRDLDRLEAVEAELALYTSAVRVRLATRPTTLLRHSTRAPRVRLSSEAEPAAVTTTTVDTDTSP